MSDEFESIFHRVAQELETREMGMTSTNTHTVSIEHGENQLGKRQDFATAGKGLDHETGEPLEWAALFDGHGSNTIINQVRNEASDAALCGDPCRALQEKLCRAQKLGYQSSGCTAIFTKVYKNRAYIQSVGDSSVIVLRDGVPIWHNSEHKWINLAERARLAELDPLIIAEPATCTRVMTPQIMNSEPSVYVTWPGGITKLAMTQALGHDGRTGIEPEEFRFDFESGHKYKIIAFSDGVGDMLMRENQEDIENIYRMNCAEIVAFATSRWRQNWLSPDPKNPEVLQGPWRYSLSSHFDDVSCVVVDIDAVPFK
jgi:serine/threonine protein phosphatase PrpC